MPDSLARLAAAVAAAWRAALDTDDDPDPLLGFVMAGGHSLAAARLVAMLRAELDVDMSITTLLREDPSLHDVVAEVARQRAEGRPAPIAVEREPPRSIALAPNLRRVWAWHRVFTGSPAYNVLRVMEIAGRVNPGALRSALATLAGRHEALRCEVDDGGGWPMVKVAKDIDVPLHLEVVEAGEVESALRSIADRPFDMKRAPMWRVGLLYAPKAGRSWLILVMHHLISDLRSSDVVLHELAHAYTARQGGGEPVFDREAASWVRYLEHESSLPSTPVWRGHLDWWRDLLAQERPRGSAFPSAAEHDFAGRVHTAHLGAVPSERIDALLRGNGLTPASYFLTAAVSVVTSWIGEPGEVVGVPSNRAARPRDADVVGFKLDTMLVPLRPEHASTFLANCHMVRDRLLNVMDHSAVPADYLVDGLGLPRSGTRHPYIRLWFNDLTGASCPRLFAGLAAEEYALPPMWALFDLNVYVRSCADGYLLHLVLPASATPGWDAQACADQIAALAVRAAAAPSSLLGELMSTVDEGAPPDLPGRPRPVPATADLLREHARRCPGRAAVIDRAGTMTYLQLEQAVAQTTVQLLALPPGSVVGVLTRRERELVVRLLSCWRAGVTVALIDAGWPQERQAKALSLAGVTHSFGGSGSLVPTGSGRAARACGHILFTSGTTGDPRPVRIAAGAVDSAVDDLCALLGLSEGARVAMLSGSAHDPALREIALAVRAAGTLVIPEHENVADPLRTPRWLAEKDVSVICATPTLIDLILADPGQLPHLQTVICGGGPLEGSTVAAIRRAAPEAVVVNGYGCTETPQLVVANVIRPQEPLPTGPVSVGRALAGRWVRVHDATGRPCPVGVPGTISVAAPHIADGYGADDASHDQSGFWTDEAGIRWWCTGDLARRDSGGRLWLEGRIDRQTHIGGYRFTLDEVEAVARSVPGVATAVCEVLPGNVGLRVRVTGSVAAQQVERRLRAVLAPALASVQVLAGSSIRLNANHKPVVAGEGGGAEEATGDETSRLRAIAERTLGGELKELENFFDAGFTSMSLLQLSGVLTAELGREVSALDLFGNPNLAALAKALFGGEGAVPPQGHTPSAPAMKARLVRMRADRERLTNQARSEGEL